MKKWQPPSSYVEKLVLYGSRQKEPEQVRLASAMQSLVLDADHPVALEITGDPAGRSFLIRTTTLEALEHVHTQLYARLPQLRFQPLEAARDPLRLEGGETVSVIELRPGAAMYLPLRVPDERLQERQDADPITGLLAALDQIPAGKRVVTQLALVPAPPTWSKADQRKAVEPALEPERRAMAQNGGESGPSFLKIVLLLLVLALLWGARQYQQQLPLWVLPALLQLAKGHGPPLSLIQQEQLYGSIGLIVFMMGLILFGFTWLPRLLQRRPIYQTRLVEQKTSRMAYRVRLRLYVIGPQEPALFTLPFLTRLCESLRAVCQTMKQFLHTFPHRLPAIWHAMKQCPQRARKRWSAIWPAVKQFPLQVHQRWLAIGHAIKHLPQRIRQIPQVLRCLLLLPWRLLLFVKERLFLLWKRLYAFWQRWRTARSLRRDREVQLSRLVAAYRQFHLASGNYFLPKQLSIGRARRALLVPRHRLTAWRYGWWHGLRRSAHLLDVEEVAQLWHLPAPQHVSDYALLEQHQARTLPIPPGLVRSGARSSPIGTAEHAGHIVPVILPSQSLERHMLICGKSGEGKSTFLAHLALALMQQGGLISLDLHGDFAEWMLRLVPPHRRDDVIWLDFSERQYAVGLNPLDTRQHPWRDKAVADLLKTLSHIWPSSWGSRMEIAFEYSLRTLFEASISQIQQGARMQYTLLDVIPLLTKESFCHQLLEQVSDPFIRRWWYTYYDPLSLYMQRDRSDPVLSKVAKFESLIARRIVGQSDSTIHLKECIQQQKIVIIKMPKGVIGEDVAPLLGAFLLGLLQLTLEAQGELSEGARKRMAILIDEFQVLQGLDWNALAELRKFGAVFFLATQSLDLLRTMENKQFLPSVLNNMKQLVAFHVSTSDAQLLHRDLDVEVADLLHLESHMCYLRLIDAQQQQPTFSLQLTLPPTGDAIQAETIRQESRQRYMVPADQVDAELELVARRGIPSSPDVSPSATSASASAAASPEVMGTASVRLSNAQARTPQVRQQAGYRGRKSQEPSMRAKDQQTQPMNWAETVGQVGVPPEAPQVEAAQEEGDPGER